MEYDPPTHVTQHWELTKPAARGRRGMVASQARDASEAGLAVLDAGGNAVDAAVATALALGAVEPWNSGLGGIGFALVHPAGAARPEVVDFGPVAPRGLDPRRFPLTGRMKQDLFSWPEVEGDANIHGPLSFAIPSQAAGLARMHERWGRLPQRELFAPALSLARRGLSADWFTTLKLMSSARVLRLYPSSAAVYLPDGLPPTPPYQGVPGFFRLGSLAETLEALQRDGLLAFYRGAVAETLAADLGELGALLDAGDLAACEATIRAADEMPYEGATLAMAGGLTASPTMRAVLSRMASVRAARPDAAWYAALAGALRAAYAERLSGLGAGEPQAAESCTTHLTVCDAEGGMVSMTTTLLSSMGSRVVLPRSGVLMNNGVMWFDPRQGQPNSMSPGRRPLTNMSPVLLHRDGRAVLAGGASGGRRILAAVVQMLEFVVRFGMDPEAAARQPRIDVSGPEDVSADPRLPPDVVAALDGPMALVEAGVLPVNYACPNLIQDRDGERVGVTDLHSPWSAALAQS